jgi:hypothetical protein
MSLETKWAMFRAAWAAQYAGEQTVTARRIAAALLSADSVREFCARARIDSALVLEVLGDPCDREARSREPGSIQERPLDPAVRLSFDPIIERHGHVGVPPLELLQHLIRSDRALAELVAPHGLTADVLAVE